MRRLILTEISVLFVFCYSSAQLVKSLKISLRKEGNGHDIAGYYQPVNNEIIVNGQEDDSTITHFFYDSSFTLKKQYSIVDTSRTVFHKKGKQFFIENICIKNMTLEVYASGEKSFTKNRNAGLLFIKPGLYNDSLVFTFGSLHPTQGVGGMILNMATMGLSSVGGLGFRIAFGSLIPYMTNKHFILFYGHSKFSVNGLKPSTANNTRTSLDDFIDDKKMGDLHSNNSVLIDMTDKLYIGIYNQKTKTFDLNEYPKRFQ